MPKTEAKKRADKKFNKKTYERMFVELRYDAEINGTAVREHAAIYDKSVNHFIKRAITETIERDLCQQENV